MASALRIGPPCFNSLQTSLNLLDFLQRVTKPLLQESPSHGGLGFVKHGQKGCTPRFPTERFKNLKIPPGKFINPHVGTAGGDSNLFQMLQMIILRPDQI